MQEEFTKERESASTKRASLMKEYLDIQKALGAAATNRLNRGHAYRSSRSPRKNIQDGTESMLNESAALVAEKQT
jgi:hypothetical protein